MAETSLRNCPVCVCSFIFVLFCYFYLMGGGVGERLRHLPWIHEPFKLQFPSCTLYTLRMYQPLLLLGDMLFSNKCLRVCVRSSSHTPLNSPNTLVFGSGFRYITMHATLEGHRFGGMRDKICDQGGIPRHEVKLP